LSGHKAHKLALISVSLDLSIHCETRDTVLVHRAVCLFTPWLYQWFSLRLFT